MESLQKFLASLVEQGEPSDSGVWYGVSRDDLPFSLLDFHFNDEGKLTTVRIASYDGETVLYSSEVGIEE